MVFGNQMTSLQPSLLAFDSVTPFFGIGLRQR